MPRLSPVQTESCIISSKWKVRRQTAQIIEPEAGNVSTIRFAIPARNRQPLV